MCVDVHCTMHFTYILMYVYRYYGCTRTMYSKAHSFAFSMCNADGALVAISIYVQKTIIFSAAIITYYELNFGYIISLWFKFKSCSTLNSKSIESD